MRFAVATASVRGFALMLLVGTAISMLTAAATRGVPRGARRAEAARQPARDGRCGGGIPRWLKLDYIGRRNTWFAISGIVVVIAVGAIAIKGLNLGIDLRGGTQIAFETPQPVSLTRCARRRPRSARRTRRSRAGALHG